MSDEYALHPDAFLDLETIRAYIAQESPDAAERILSEIFRQIRVELVPFPNSGHRRSDLTSRPLRFTVAAKHYLIAYAPNEEPLWIVAILDGRQNPRVMAAVLRGREQAKQANDRSVLNPPPPSSP
jgi:antitoxin ParD1/3/4/toxin ParE1/3/4